MNRRPVAAFVGAMLALVGLAELVAGAIALSWGPDARADSLLLGGSASALFGLFLWFTNKKKRDEPASEFHRREALAAVGLGWPVIVVFGG